MEKHFQPFSFAIIADLHIYPPKWGKTYHGLENLEWFVNWVKGRKEIEFVLVLGDLLTVGVPFLCEWHLEELQTTFSRIGRHVHVVYGNNDPKLTGLETYEAIWGKKDRTFEHRGCLFVLMWDCMTHVVGHGHEGWFSEAQWPWLEQQLKEARQQNCRHVFFAAHVPPPCPEWHQPGLFMEKSTERRFREVCTAYGITAAFFGHIHIDSAITFARARTKIVETPALNTLNFLPPPPHDQRRRSVNGHFSVIHVHDEGITSERLTVGSPDSASKKLPVSSVGTSSGRNGTPKRFHFGNMPPDTTEDEVRKLFAPLGGIISLKLVANPKTGEFRGFGFAEMDVADVSVVTDALDLTDFRGRRILVNEAAERCDSGPFRPLCEK